jgi:hypothetical protein
MEKRLIWVLIALTTVGLVLGGLVLAGGNQSGKGTGCNGDCLQAKERTENKSSGCSCEKDLGGKCPVENAIDAGDYAAWKKAAEGKPCMNNLINVITEENFPRYAEMRKAADAGDNVTSEKLRTELGLAPGAGICQHKNVAAGGCDGGCMKEQASGGCMKAKGAGCSGGCEKAKTGGCPKRNKEALVFGKN